MSAMDEGTITTAALILLYRYVDNDAALLQKILVDNPARLHGFTD